LKYPWSVSFYFIYLLLKKKPKYNLKLLVRKWHCFIMFISLLVTKCSASRLNYYLLHILCKHMCLKLILPHTWITRNIFNLIIFLLFFFSTFLWSNISVNKKHFMWQWKTNTKMRYEHNLYGFSWTPMNTRLMIKIH